MIEFMVIGPPRSGTTWAANWLTTERTLCLHDPLWTMHYTEIDNYPTSRRLGVSCTGLLMFPEWLNRHPARKLVLHRPLEEVNASLDEIGLDLITDAIIGNLDRIEGMHVFWMDLFNTPEKIHQYLLGEPHDIERHQLLKQMEIQPNFEGLTISREVTKRLVNELRSL